jgi:hypothetical protein
VIAHVQVMVRSEKAVETEAFSRLRDVPQVVVRSSLLRFGEDPQVHAFNPAMPLAE